MRNWFPMVVLLAACAPAAQAPLQSPTQVRARVEPTAGGFDVLLNQSDMPVGAVFPLPADRVWPVAVAAYTATGLRVDGSDTAQRLVETSGQPMIRRFAGHPLSYYFDCGSDLTGSIANAWRVKVTARMGVTPAAGDSSQVVTMLTIRASPLEGTSAAITQCTSTGRLEQAITDRIRQALAEK